MSENGLAPTPQVFVVDSQATYLSVPSGKKSTWARAGQKFLPLLLTLFALAIFVEGYLIYMLYQRTEAFSGCVSNNMCHNLSRSVKTEQQNGRTSSQIGAPDSNEIPPLKPEKRPFAHLMGAQKSNGEVVQWKSQDHYDKSRIKYRNSRLVIDQEGHYYVYSKLVVDVSEATSPIFHKIQRKPSGYAESIELLKSKSNWSPEKSPGDAGEDKWRSFLSGIFFLQEGDEIYVTLSKMEKLSPEANENCLGAFWLDS
ncbi:tumor necrosis factor [Poeciliopsis prolifica]|uniref:tumor necrosis factor n=1 Tax=Poeciliopsis prolifica TaxID=188132 RepID=UPI0024135B21|nr:tumor necrosis factor [Poeciliopsis prolifica]XP_054897639.1 tumor necrosis factor [Poeciliopsis prolifica]